MSEFLHRRGPDHFENVDISISSDINLRLSSSALQLRGEVVCKQPLQDQNGNILQWNGQIFDGEIFVSEYDSDTKILMNYLSKCNEDDEILNVFSKIQGPWAFSYWNDKSKCLWFGRDIFGRRSLCWNVNERSKLLMISSVTFDAQFDDGSAVVWEEIPANGIYCLDLSSLTLNKFKHFNWDKRISGEIMNINFNQYLKSPISIPLNQMLPHVDDLAKEIPNKVIEDFIDVLKSSVQKRCLNQQGLCKECFIRLNCQKYHDNDATDSEGDTIGNGSSLNSNFHLSICTHASIAVLFSGGLDSAVLALLADECIPKSLPIDLLNVAFDNEAPDRDTGLNAWNELKLLRPDRMWNFVSIFISKEELQSIRKKHVKYLVKPSQTVLDDSIGCALWFAARGKGLLLDDTSEAYSYTTQARVVLLGIGADEQLAGYSRHRRIFDKEGCSGLINELAVEIDRLSSRNLGRDDRVVSDHGREPRYPFLDENVVNFLNALPIWHKCNLKLDRAAGEKLLLRKVAQRLGLYQTSQHLKRAIQFGSRIAKIEENHEKGNDVCSRLS